MIESDQYDNIPHCCVLGVKTILVHNGKILLLRRSDGVRKDGWDFTGGLVNLGEDPEHASAREAKEETGLQIQNLRILGTYSIVTRLRDGQIKHTVMVGYCADVNSREVRLSGEHDKYQWVDPREALNLEFPEGHRKFLKALVEQA